MTRMFGRWPDGVVAACCWACATLTGALAPIADAAANVVPPNRILRRSRAPFFVIALSRLSLLLMTFSHLERHNGNQCGQLTHFSLTSTFSILPLNRNGR